MVKQKRVSKRMTITVSPESHDVLMRFKDQTGESASSFIDSIIKQSSPALERLIEAHKSISSDRANGVSIVKDVLQRASDDLERQSSEISRDLDTLGG